MIVLKITAKTYEIKSSVICAIYVAVIKIYFNKYCRSSTQ